MSDYEDYENNLAFPPTTDSTQSSVELVERIEKLTEENARLKELLEECLDNITDSWDSFIDIAAGGETAELIDKINEVLKDD